MLNAEEGCAAHTLILCFTSSDKIMPRTIRNKMSNKRRRLVAAADIPHEVTMQCSRHSQIVHSSGQSVASPSHSIVTTLVADPPSFTLCGKLLSEIDNPSVIAYSTCSRKKGKFNITDRIDSDSSHVIGCHPIPNDGDLLGAINSESSYEAVALLTRGNTFTEEGFNQALLAACRRGHKLLVQTLIQDGSNIEHRDEHGNTPLLICAENGFTDIVRFLVSKHANVKAVNSVGNTALILSMHSSGSTDLTRFLLEQQGVDVHHENRHGHTALMRATQFMDVDTMRLLLEKSMRKTSDKEYRNVFPREYNTDNCFFNSRSQEIKQRIIIDKTGLGGVYEILQEHLITGTSLLELAIKAGDTKSLDRFLDCQFSSREEKKRYVDSALKYVFQNLQYSVQKFSSVDVKIIQTLLQYGADVNQGNENKLISLVLESGNFQVAEPLCTHGADMKGHYSREEDPLVIAAKLGRPDLIKLLLKYKAAIDRTDFSDSALDCALRNDHTECAKLLIQRGAKMDVRSALKSAVDHQVSKYMCFLYKNCNLEIMDYFSQKPEEVRKLLNSAIEKGNCEIIGQILDTGVSINETDSTGQTPLMASKNREVTEFLIQRGADINQEIEGRYGSDTILTYMIKYRDCKDKSTLELCKVLIDNGALVNCRSGEEKTPLMLVAAQNVCVDMLQILLDNGADINDKDSAGNTALFHAVKRNNKKHVRCLLDCGRDKKSLINIQNKEGITPLMLSVQEGYVRIVKELLENGADVNIKDNRENIALHHLLIDCYKNIEENLPFLLKAGSHVNWQNSDGLSPLMLAAEWTMPSVISSLLEAGAQINAVSKTKYSQTALSFLSDSFMSNFELNLEKNTRSCFNTLINGGAFCSYFRRECIQELIIGSHLNIIFKLILHGVGPADVDKIQLRIGSSSVPSTVSPLCFALLLGRDNLARYFVEILFLTSSDLSMFASNKAMECLLQQYYQKDSLRFLQEISSQPMSLVKLSLVTVSAAVGSSPGRETRVDSLPLPQRMKDRLLFKSVGGEHTALAEILSEVYTPYDRVMLAHLLRRLEIKLYDSSDDEDNFFHPDPLDSDNDTYDAY